MPIRLVDLAKERRELTIHTPLGPLNIVYRPNARTPADIAKYRGITDDAEKTKAMLDVIADVVCDWDLLGPVYHRESGEQLVEEDAPIPIKPEILQFVSDDLLLAIMREVEKDKTPKEKNSSRKSADLYSVKTTSSFS